MGYINKQNIDAESLRHPSDIQSLDAIIGGIATAINDSVKHRCLKVIKYMRAFLLDLIHAIARFDLFMLPLLDLEFWLNLQKKLYQTSFEPVPIPIRDLIQIRIVYSTDNTPELLV